MKSNVPEWSGGALRGGDSSVGGSSERFPVLLSAWLGLGGGEMGR